MRKRILIIDDDIITLKILKKYLDEKYDVTIENSGYRFVDKMDEYSADLILLDIEMPVMNGLLVFDRIIVNKQMKNVPVAFLTGVASPEVVRSVFAKGAAGYLLKTAPKSELLDQVGKLLSERRERSLPSLVAVLEANPEVARTVKVTLEEADIEVKLFHSLFQLAEYLSRHEMSVLILGRDASGSMPSDERDVLKQQNLLKSSEIILMEQPFSASELLEKVEKALE